MIQRLRFCSRLPDRAARDRRVLPCHGSLKWEGHGSRFGQPGSAHILVALGISLAVSVSSRGVGGMADNGVGGKDVALAGVEPASLGGGPSEVPLLHSARPANRGRDTRRGRLEGVLRLHPGGRGMWPRLGRVEQRYEYTCWTSGNQAALRIPVFLSAASIRDSMARKWREMSPPLACMPLKRFRRASNGI